MRMSLRKATPSARMRHRIFRFENPDYASGYVVRERETTGLPTVLSYLKRA